MSSTMVLFTLTGIRLEQFATISENYVANAETFLNGGYEVGVEPAKKQVSFLCNLWYEQANGVFLKISASCHFQIEPQSWQKLVDEKGQEIVFPKDFIIHLATLTVGTVRGILFAKTENTEFNQYVLPTINLVEKITSDVRFAIEQPINS